MAKLIEVQVAKEIADAYMPDIFLKMAVNQVLDVTPGFDLVHCAECQHWDTKNCSEDQGWCPKVMGYRPSNWYCAAGKSKQDETVTECHRL